MTVTLRGMTWDHARAVDPLLACTALWRAGGGADIVWDARSLQDFESYPVEDLARRYDLIVIDHPHVGQITAEGCLLPLDAPGREAERAAIAAGSVGPSFTSYEWQGRVWAFPIDAATQVQAWRPDLLPAPASDWDAVLALAAAGKVALPLRTPHAAMCLFSLAGPCATVPGPLLDRGAATRAFTLLSTLATHLDPRDFDADPIAVAERMAEGGLVACAPLIYGYVPYARDGFRVHRLGFADAPDATPAPTLGGTGIAVSAFTAHPDAAIAFAHWLASPEVQRGPYAAAGGQPGHAAAWEDAGVNAPVHDFYRATRRTLEASALRPRHAGYMAFQDAASRRISAGLRAGEAAGPVLDDLDALFAASFGAA